MNPEELQELKELIDFLKRSEIAEFDLERGELKVRLKFASAIVAPAATPDLAALARLFAAQPVAVAQPYSGPFPAASQPAPTAPMAPAAAPPAESAEEALHILKSPIVGTFYESPSPGASAFVVVGDSVQKGQVICIVEAMKLMNEIECDATGEIVKRLVNNGQAVEYGQPLFAIREK